MLGHRGESSRTFAEATRLGAELRLLAPLQGSRVRARVAMVVDWDSWWASSAPDSLPSQRLRYPQPARAWHAACFALGQPVDAVRAIGPFDGYDVVLVPGLYIADAEQAAALAGFTAAGGTVVVGPFSGVADADDRVHENGPPGPLRDLLGIEVDEHWPLPDGATGTVELLGDRHGNPVWSEWIEPASGTETIGAHVDGELAGRAAVTRRAHGTGSAWYTGVVLDPDGTAALLRAALTAAGLATRERTDPALEALTRSDDATDYTFVLNHGTADLTVDVPAAATDLLGGEPVDGRLTLGRYGVAVLATPRAAQPPFITLSDRGAP
jgi:beta-galactosidase